MQHRPHPTPIGHRPTRAEIPRPTRLIRSQPPEPGRVPPENKTRSRPCRFGRSMIRLLWRRPLVSSGLPWYVDCHTPESMIEMGVSDTKNVTA